MNSRNRPLARRSPHSGVRSTPGFDPDRRGSVLIVVIGLLLLLMLIGITFFTYANQEHSSAEYYSEATKVYTTTAFDADVLWNWGLEQLIIGPHDNNTQSALWPGKYSLVPNALGLFSSNVAAGTDLTQPGDRHPFNGGDGINVIVGSNGQAYVDQNFNGLDDVTVDGLNSSYLLKQLNLSGAAQYAAQGAGFTTRQLVVSSFPQPDVGYTYPDINNLYLAYVGSTSVGSATSPATVPVYIPSFHRPQYLRDANTGSPTTFLGINGALGWQADNSGTSTDTTTRVLRPHPGHVVVADPNAAPNKRFRFIRSTDNFTNSLGVKIKPFPFQVNANGDVDGNGNPIYGEEGIWRSSPFNPASLAYDADNDGDGIPEGIWLDLNFALSTLTDGRKVMPLFSYTVLEVDSNINLNTSGNITWLPQSQTLPFYGVQPNTLASGSPYSISHSNLGVSPTEINPFWALVANPQSSNFLASPTSVALQQYRGFFNIANPAGFSASDRAQMANMDMLFRFWGRPRYEVVTSNGLDNFILADVTAGLWGEQSALVAGLQGGNNGSLFPRPGASNVDDDGDAFFGITDKGDPTLYQFPLSNPTTSGTLLFPQFPPPFVHPIDPTGAGTWVTTGGTNGSVAFLANLTANGSSAPALYPASAAAFLQYAGYPAVAMSGQSYFPYFTTIPYDGTLGTYVNANGPLLSQFQASYTSPYYTNNGIGLLVDEADEVAVDRRFPQPQDQIFTPDEIAALQLAQTDYSNIVAQSRLRQLMSFNLDSNLQAQSIRKRFTTESWDRRQNGWALETDPSPGAPRNRAWEYGGGTATVVPNWDGTSTNAQPAYQFPPMVIGSSTDGLVPAQANNPAGGKAEPFRMELAALIGSKANNSFVYGGNYANAFNTPAYDFPSQKVGMTPWQQQLRLNINRVVTCVDPNAAFGTTNPTNAIRFRELTPHPTFTQWGTTTTTAINTTLGAQGAPLSPTSPLAYPSASNSNTFTNNLALQEYWARRDRQQMARDIYVMLYMFGGGVDTNTNGFQSANYAGTPNSGQTLYQNWQLAEMAQFAVNYVDALDRDDTITIFEYDVDLSNGWDLDDDPMTTFDGGTNRRVAYGVEAQQLAFNEAMVIASQRVPKFGVPNTYTTHPALNLDSATQDRTFTFLELFNVSQNGVSVANGNWQILLLDPASPFPGQQFNPQPNSEPYSNGNYVVGNGGSAAGLVLNALTLNDAVNGTVAGGEPYTIGSRTYIAGTDDANGGPIPSVFSVDAAFTSGSTGTPTQKVPSLNASFPATSLSLDLVGSTSGTATTTGIYTRYTLTDYKYGVLQQNGSFSPIGQFCDLTIGVNGAPGANKDVTAGAFMPTGTTTASTTFVLRRRVNLNRPAPKIADPSFNATDEQDNPWIEVDRITYTNSKPPADVTTGQIVAFPNGSGTAPTSGTLFQLRDPTDPGNQANAGLNDIQPKLARLLGRVRRQPLDGYEGATSGYTITPPSWPSQPTGISSTYGTSRVAYWSNNSASPYVTITPNTIGQAKSVLVTAGAITPPNVPQSPNTLWQPHFDRDFASVMELLSVPLYSPSTLTQSVAAMSNTANNYIADEAPSPALAGRTYMPLVAQAKFFRPQHPLNVGVAAATQQLDNRWYRLFELVEVPSRSNAVVETYFQTQYQWIAPYSLQRVPGRMNLNGTRYPENLFALLDDGNLFSVANYQTDGAYTDNFEGSARNWWQQLLTSRDGSDPQILSAYNTANGTTLTSFPVPGSPAARPIRSFSSFERNPTAYNATTIAAGNPMPPFGTDDTLFKTLPNDGSLGSLANIPANGSSIGQRRMFEARTVADVGNNTVDPYTRQRLLAKIAGNTTNRSNVFIVWMSVGFFEAYQPDPTNNPNIIQIGAEMSDQPRRRGFFVVDRSLLEDAWVAPQYDVNGNLVPNTGVFNYLKFIQYRKTIQ
jgi:hypothetical protein